MFKKATIAVAVALATAGVAQAQSNVQVYGRMAGYVESTKEGTAGSLTKQTADVSWIGIRGSEDLGGGVKANFKVETRVINDDPQTRPFGGDWATVGLSNNLGSLDLGRARHALGTAIIKYDLFYTDYATTFDDIHSAQNRRLSNGVFARVNVNRAVSVGYDRGMSETAGVKDQQVYSVNAQLGNISGTALQYTDGGLNKTSALGVEVKVPTTGTTLVGFYSEDRQNGVDSTGKSVGVRQRLVGPLSAQAGYGKTDFAQAYTAGVTYNFSKRTMMHARYGKVDHDNATLDRRQVGVGIEHWF